MGRITIFPWILLSCGGVAVTVAAPMPPVHLRGAVVNENRVPVPGARVTVGAETAVTGVQGAFSLTLPAAGTYTVSVQRDGHFPLRLENVEAPGEVTLSLTQARELVQSLEVTTGTPHALEADTTGVRQSVSNTDLVNAPYPNTNDLRSALRIAPGVVRDMRGNIHLHGSAEEQLLYTLNGFNLGDPLTNRFESRMSVESVQSVELQSGSLPAEFGKGAGGAMSVRSISGDDRLRASATNFFPGFENRKGIILGDWTPRAGLSGPLLRGRAWFSDSVDIQYNKTVIQDLPKGEDRSSSLRWSNLLHSQFNLRPDNILHASFLASAFNAPRSGLGVLDPIETTVDRRARQWFFSVRDQAYLRGGALVEFGVAVNRTFGREIPQGQELLAITTEGRRGNAVTDAQRRGGRDQLLVNAFLPSWNFAGAHQFKGGIDLNRVSYWQEAYRTGFENVAATGAITRRTLYQGNGQLARRNHEAAAYLQDSWRARPGLAFELGARLDWDDLLRRWNASPRAGVAWMPAGLGGAKLSAGFGRVYDASPLRLFARPLDQFSVTTFYLPTGQVERGPEIALFSIADPRLARPRYHNWNASIERHWNAWGLSARADYVRRRGTRGLAFTDPLGLWRPAAPGPGQRLLELANVRADKYDGVTLTVRQHLRRQYEWSATYTRSDARSNLVLDPVNNETLRVEENRGALPWDSTNRFLAWGYLPLPRPRWAVAVLADYRTGFPFSLYQPDGAVLGPVSSRRFPAFFEGNLHLERQFTMRGHRWAFRFGFNNITNRRNPTAVYDVAGGAFFGQFHGGVGRASNFRIRWMGRAGT